MVAMTYFAQFRATCNPTPIITRYMSDARKEFTDQHAGKIVGNLFSTNTTLSVEIYKWKHWEKVRMNIFRDFRD